LSQKNLGAAQARSLGVNHAKGEYIIFLDADDILLESAVSHLVTKLEESNNYIASYGTKTKYYNDGKVMFVLPRKEQAVDGDILPALLKGVPLLSNGNICIRKVFIEKVEFPKNIHQGEDWITWCRLALLGDIVFAGEKLVLKIRSHKNNASNLTYKKPELLYEMLDEVYKDETFINKLGADKIKKYFKAHRLHINNYLYHTFKNRGQYIMAFKQKMLRYFWR
jgi:glycosyltransferase involved in cell wall biosynthesis